MPSTRRTFLRQSTTALASLSALSRLPTHAQSSSSNPANSLPLPPHLGSTVPGIHGYAEQSVAAGETIHFRVSATVAHRLSVYRLGPDPDSPAQDELLHAFPESDPSPQPIHPGSYVAVENNLSGPLRALTLETWLRPWKLAGRSGVITQHDETDTQEFGLFLAADLRVTFSLGTYGPPPDTPAVKLTANQWSHVVAVWDGAYAALYLDGTERARWQCPASLTVGKEALRLGALGRDGVAAGFLDADLAMPAVYTRALTPAEIAARFAAKALTPATGEGLAACWPFREQQGDQLADISGLRRPGRLINHGTRMIPGPSLTTEVPRFATYDPARDPQRGHALRLAADDLYDCRWSVTTSYTIPATARPGIYVGRIAYTWEGKPHLYHITFVVRRAPRASRAPLLVLAATNTWRAYCSAAFPKPNPALLRNVGTGGQVNSPGNPPRTPSTAATPAARAATSSACACPSSPPIHTCFTVRSTATSSAPSASPMPGSKNPATTTTSSPTSISTATPASSAATAPS